MDYLHKGEREQCPYCKDSFRKDNLDRHIHAVHMKVPSSEPDSLGVLCPARESTNQYPTTSDRQTGLSHHELALLFLQMMGFTVADAEKRLRSVDNIFEIMENFKQLLLGSRSHLSADTSETGGESASVSHDPDTLVVSSEAIDGNHETQPKQSPSLFSNEHADRINSVIDLDTINFDSIDFENINF